MNILEWLTGNWADVLAVIGGVISVATVIVKLTPSQTDDAVLGRIIAVLEKFSIVNPNGSEVVKK